MTKLITLIMITFTLAMTGCAGLPKPTFTNVKAAPSVNTPDSIEQLIIARTGGAVDERKVLCDKALPPPSYELPTLRDLSEEELASYLGTAKALIGMLKEHQELIRNINADNKERYRKHSRSCRLV